MLRLQGRPRIRRWFFFAIVAFFLGAGAARGQAPAADPVRGALQRRLVRAVAKPDRALLERAARRLGLAGLLRCLRSKKRKVVLAAVRAAPLAERAWQLVPALVELVRRPGADRQTAARAAAAIRAIAEQVREPDLDQIGELPDRVRDVADDLLALATNRNLSLDIRVQSVMALAQLTDVAQLPESRLLPLLAAPEPALREAATQLFAVGAAASAVDRLAQLVARDPSLAVARAAAATLCASVRLRGRHPGAAVSALRRTRAGSRVRELAESLDATDDQLLDLARCLRRSKDPEDRSALAQLRRRSVRLRRLVRRIR